MRLARLALPLLMLIALTGAPFGMGRMMDSAAGHDAEYHMNHMGGTEHGKMPSHEPSAPHYMVCTACIPAPAIHAEIVRLVAMEETRSLIAVERLDGTRFMPPVPPPRV